MFAKPEELAALIARYDPPCRCGTGNYCHQHRQYGLIPSAGKKEYRLSLAEENKSSHQKCGGGRRINRKRIGET